jgi:hypothetical protein
VGYTAIFAGVIIAVGFCGVDQCAGITSLAFYENGYKQLFLGLLAVCLFVVSFIGGTSLSFQLLNESGKKIEHYHLIWVLQALLLAACFEVSSAANRSLSIPLAVVTFAFLLALQKAVMTRSSADALGWNHADTVSLTGLGIELGNFIYECGTADASDKVVRDTSRTRLQVLLFAVVLFVLGLWAGAMSFHELGYRSCLLLVAGCIGIWILCLISDRRTKRP